MRKKVIKRTRTTKTYLDAMAEAAEKATEAKKDMIAAANGNGKKSLAENKVPEVKKHKSGRMEKSRAFYLAVCVTSGLLGIGSVVLYFTTLNIMWGYFMLPFMGLAWWMFYIFRRQHEQVTDLVMYGDAVSKAQVNGMSIYPMEKGGVIFENYTDTHIKELKDAGATPKVCVNDGKPYYVTIWQNKTLTPFTLPDQQYYDPRVFGERVLELPAHRRLFQRKQSLLQKLSPFLLILVMVIEWILIITTTTPKGS